MMDAIKSSTLARETADDAKRKSPILLSSIIKENDGRVHSDTITSEMRLKINHLMSGSQK